MLSSARAAVRQARRWVLATAKIMPMDRHRGPFHTAASGPRGGQVVHKCSMPTISGHTNLTPCRSVATQLAGSSDWHCSSSPPSSESARSGWCLSRPPPTPPASRSPSGSFPFHIAITPNGKAAYATSDSGLTPINTTTTKTPGKTIKGLSGPIAITPDGTTVYTGSSNHTVTPVSTATNKPGKAITVGSDPVAIAITP
jgi:hypothetical protein